VQEVIEKRFYTEWADLKDNTAIHYCRIHLEFKYREKWKRKGRCNI